MRAGETLYSIAWEAGRDYHDVAAWNSIEPPYLIKPGQLIRLHPPSATGPAAHAKLHVVAPGDTLYSIAGSAGVRYQDLAQWNNIDPPYTLRVGQQLRLTASDKTPPALPTERETKTAVSTKPRLPPARNEPEGTAEVKWAWPVEGAILARFAASGTSKGIDIAGTAGQPIRAAASGKVVYQGSGLRGYGQLIIVKHNADFLSAYAHCAAIYVQEGSVIKPGQIIATMGSSGTDRVKLHFEIRRRGVPVDPLEHLPK